MRLKPHLPARVVWQEGMYLAPHHFQAQRRHAEDTLALAVDALFPFAYGVAALTLDEDALRTGTVTLRHARGILPDGTPFHAPDTDPLPPPLRLADRFSPTQDSHVVHLALPAWRGEGANVDVPDGDGRDGAVRDGLGAAGWAGEMSDGVGPRYAAVDREVVDEVSGMDAVPIRVAAKRLRLALDVELAPGEVALPIARVRRDGSGRLVYDTDFVPPCLQLGASPRLVALLHGVAEMLDAKGASLAASLVASAQPAADAAAGAPSAYAGNEIATRWMLHAVRSAEAPLRHLLQTRRAHPERLWLELVRLGGALCTFSLTSTPRELPTYAHDDLAGCFGALERHVRMHLDVVVTPRAVVIPLARTSEVLHVGTVTDPRAFEPGARWFLAVRSAVGPVETAVRVPALAKACASKFVLELVRRAYPGMTLEHVPAPPAAIAPRADRAYFEIALAGPCAQGLRETREIGVYLPDGLPEAAAELTVLAPT